MKFTQLVVSTLLTFLVVCILTTSAMAQTSLAPDIYLPEFVPGSYPFTSSRDQCAIVADPRLSPSGRPFENFTVLEGFDTYADPGSSTYLDGRRRLTFVTTQGVHQAVDSFSANGQSRNVTMSRDGRNIAFFGYPTATSGLMLYFSSDYGASFVHYPLPTNPLFTYMDGNQIGSWAPGSLVHGNLAFDENGNLFVFYIGRLAVLPIVPQTSHTAELYLGVLDPSGAIIVPPFVVTELSVTMSSTGVASTPRPSTVAIGHHIVYTSHWGKGYSDGSTNPPLPNYPMIVVIDTRAPSINIMNFGGSVNSYRLSSPWQLFNHSLSSLYSDGESVYLLTNATTPAIQAKNSIIRRFSPTTANYANFFINTAAPGADPFMDLDDPQLQFGTDISQITAPYGIPLTELLIESVGVRQKGNGFNGDEVLIIASKKASVVLNRRFNMRFRVANINGTPKVVTVDDVVDVPDSVIRAVLFEPDYPRGSPLGTIIRPPLPQVHVQPSGQNYVTGFCMRLAPQPGNPLYGPYPLPHLYSFFGADVS